MSHDNVLVISNFDLEFVFFSAYTNKCFVKHNSSDRFDIVNCDHKKSMELIKQIKRVIFYSSANILCYFYKAPT